MVDFGMTGDEGVSPRLRQTSFVGIISEHPEMRRIFHMIERIARCDSTALILGESGTGKELIARAIHRLSGRTGKLVPVNCGAIPEELLESELFGHEKGSFTGATNAKIGRFQLADGGTIFLDEIGEMSPKLQVKLLRVLQERVIDPVGSTRSIDIKVRVIAATNKDLREEVRAGRFREDLYYRLQVLPIELPPLRDRASDVTILAEHFLKRACENLGRPMLRLHGDVTQILREHSWPGNIRELENVIERVAVLTEGEWVGVEDLPVHISNGLSRRLPTTIMEVSEDFPDCGLDFNGLIDTYETKLITLALNKTKGNKKAAARLLNLNRTTLVEKIKKKGLSQFMDGSSDGGCDSRPEFELGAGHDGDEEPLRRSM